MKVKQKFSLSLLIAGMVVLLIAVNLLQSMLFGRSYIDLTEDKRFSLTPQTVEFLKSNDALIIIRLYQSKDLLKQNRVLGEYAEYIRKLLMEYKKYGGKKIELSVIDVEPFTNTQVEAEKAGIKPFDFNDGKGLQYLGASFISADGRSFVIDKFYPERLNSVEDDITRQLSVLAKNKKTRLGIISPFFKIAESENILHQKDDYPFVRRLKNQGYDVVSISEKLPYISNDIDVVLLFYPVKLETTSIYAIDQYLMRGGKVMVMLDTFSEDRFKNKDEYISYNSGMQKFLENIGVVYYDNLLIGDGINSREMVLDGRKIKYPFWINIGKSHLKDHFITRNIKNLYINHAGFFDYKDNDDVVETVLLGATKKSGIMKTEILANLNMDTLQQNYSLSEDSYPLAILLEGKFKSLFNQPLVLDKRLLSVMPAFLSIPIDEGKLLLVSDADMANGNLWQETKSDDESKDITDNFIFIRNALDYLSQNGYASAGLKNIVKTNTSLSSVAYAIAEASYHDEKVKISSELVSTKKRIDEINSNGVVKALSIKQMKEIEELKRQEIAYNQDLQRIVYLIGKRYQNILSVISGMLVLILPLLSVGIIYGIYCLYGNYLRRKIKGLINE